MLFSKFRIKKYHSSEHISTLQFEVTNNCNLRCSICWRALRNQEARIKNIAFDRFRNILDKAMSIFPIREVNLQGLGEPTMCPDILEMLAYAKSKGLSVWFVTNGTLINNDLARSLVEIGVDKIRLSVDSADPEVYASIKCGSNLETITQNMNRLNHYKEKLNKQTPAVAFNSVIMKRNFSAIEKLVKLARRYGVDEITFIPLVNFSKGLSVEEEQVNFYNDDFQARFETLKKGAIADGVELNKGISLESRDVRFCDFGLYIDSDCIVHPCCNISRFTLGNINEQKANLILNKYIKFKRWLNRRHISCKECNRILDKR